jgi:glycosyltransferase 2 family protein
MGSLYSRPFKDCDENRSTLPPALSFPALCCLPDAVRKLNALFLVLAFSLLIYFLHKVGWARIAFGFARVGWGFLIPLALFTAQSLVETWNWGRCFRDTPPYRRLIVPFWCGQSINLLTPGASLGEATKGGMLAPSTGSQAVVSSLILYNLAYSYALALILMAAATSLWMLPGSHAALRIAGSAFSVTMFMGLLGFHRGLLRARVSGVLRFIATRIALRKFDRGVQAIRSWEAEIAQHAHDLPWRLHQIVAVCLLTQCIPVVELWATWMLLGVRLNLAQCFVFVGTDTLMRIVFSVVPGQVGVQEGSHYLTSGLLSLDPFLGLTRQLIGRCARLVYATAGGLILAWITVRRPNKRTATDP